ncbi:NAD(P)-binding protein, partial [Gonapodya prolifera JEL478]
VTGANRGIGLGLVTALITRPNTTVFAGVRDPAKATGLIDLQATHPNLHILKVTSADEKDNAAAVAEIERRVGRLDVVIANAGIAKTYAPIDTTPVADYREHWEVNTLGPLVLWQAVAKLLLASPTREPYFGVISTVAATSLNQYDLPCSGSSKAAANFLVKALHAEHEAEGLIATAIHPGMVATEMGAHAVTSVGLPPDAPVSVQASVAGVLSHVDGATRAAKGGKFLNYNSKGGDMPWDFHTEELAW